jgi:predicted MFS family arabinose efflux permease
LTEPSSPAGRITRSVEPDRPDDRLSLLGVTLAYGLALGIATVIIPLVALDAGYDAAAVGFLVAISAGCQLATRLGLPWLLGRFPDRTLMGLACGGMAVSFGLLITSTALPVFVAAQLFQGASRAMYWTSSQTHAIRDRDRPVQRLADLNVSGSIGTLSGPAVGGMLAVIGLPVALGVAVVAAVIGAVGTRLLHRLRPYDRRHSAGALRLLRRDGVDVACWASAVSGAWWSMMGSYVPVLAVSVGIGSVGIGWLITASEAAGMTALLVIRRLAPARIRVVVRGAAVVVVAALVGLAVAAYANPAMVAVAFAALLILGGASSGTITTLSAAMASLAALPDEQGDAMALTGTFRAGALLGAPAAVGGLLAVVGVPLAVALMAGIVGIPGVLVGRPRGKTDESG